MSRTVWTSRRREAHLAAAEQDHRGEEDRREDRAALEHLAPRRRLRSLASLGCAGEGCFDVELFDTVALLPRPVRLARLVRSLDGLLDPVLVDVDEVVVVPLLLGASPALLLSCH